MSITRNRELSQFGSFIYINDPTQGIGIATETTPYIGIGTHNPVVKLHVVGDTNIDGDLTVINGAIEATSYTLNGNPLVNASVEYWTFATNQTDIYRLAGNIGIGTSVLTQKLTVLGNVSAGQFISTVTSGTAPFVVLSDTQVTNLNASFLRGKTPPTGTIVGTTDTQTLTNKTLTSPTLTSPSVTSGGINLNGSTLGITILQSSAVASGTLTLPATTDTLVARNTTDTLTNKTIAAGSNTITGLTNTNLSGTAGITNANLANSTISGISLGSNLASLSFGGYITSTGSYNGSTARTVSVAATSENLGNTIVARDINGDFTAGSITASTFDATTTDAYQISGTTVIDSNRDLINIVDGSFSGAVTASNFIGNGSGLTGVGLSVSNETLSTETFYPLLTQTTAGIAATGRVSSTKLTFNPSTGTLTVTDINSTSDANLKENIKTVDNSLEIINSLRGVSFDWKESGKSSYGVIAQELEEVLPELVVTGEVKSVNYNGIIGVLIEAVKELKMEIEELKGT